MADEDHSDESLRHTLGLLVRPVREALFSESAPRDANRPWPPLPRRARRRVEGRVPFPLAAQLVDLGIALACFFGTYSLLMTETARLDKEVWSPLLML